MQLPRTGSGRLAMSTFVVRCTFAGRPRRVPKGSTWFVFSTTTSCVWPQQARSTRFTLSKHVSTWAASRLKKPTTAEVRSCATGKVVELQTNAAKGLQCHTAPFSWKLVFECDSQLYELLMTACSPREQEEWRSRLTNAAKGEQEQIDPSLYSSMFLSMKSLGTMFRKPGRCFQSHINGSVPLTAFFPSPGTVARRISIHRATTVGPKSPLCQVILKNTSVVRDNSDAASNSSINRSQSLLTTNPRIPIIAPPRGERARLEALMSDIWSRDILPFPGMTGRSRSEHLVRSSASTMMRKLSVASIASSFAKRSNSVASLGKLVAEDDTGDKGSTLQGHPSKLCRAESSNTEHGPDDEVENTKGARLPKIDDDVEVTSTVSAPATPMLLPSAIFVHADPVEQLWSGHDGRAFSNVLPSRPTVLRTASGNNLPRIRRDPITPKMSPCPSERDEKDLQINAAKAPRLSHKPSMRWGRVGTLNRDDLVQGIRSFFR